MITCAESSPALQQHHQAAKAECICISLLQFAADAFSGLEVYPTPRNALSVGLLIGLSVTFFIPPNGNARQCARYIFRKKSDFRKTFYIFALRYGAQASGTQLTSRIPWVKESEITTRGRCKQVFILWELVGGSAEKASFSAGVGGWGL